MLREIIESENVNESNNEIAVFKGKPGSVKMVEFLGIKCNIKFPGNDIPDGCNLYADIGPTGGAILRVDSGEFFEIINGEIKKLS
jgi:hypothetical protein